MVTHAHSQRNLPQTESEHGITMTTLEVVSVFQTPHAISLYLLTN